MSNDGNGASSCNHGRSIDPGIEAPNLMPFVCLVKFLYSTAGNSVLGLNTTAEKAARILERYLDTWLRNAQNLGFEASCYRASS